MILVLLCAHRGICVNVSRVLKHLWIRMTVTCLAELQLRAASATFNSTPPTLSATRKPTHQPVNPYSTITMAAAWKVAGLSYAPSRSKCPGVTTINSA